VTTNQIIAITGVVTVVVTAIAIFVALKGVRDQLWLHTFSEWTGRYLDYVRELPGAARDPAASFALDGLSDQERARTVNAVRMYVNLCSEEHYLHSLGKIDHRTWDIWALGMADAFRASWFRELWADLRHEYAPYTEFRAFFDDLASAGERPVYPRGEASTSPGSA
jgi:hypothetical protein